MKNRERPISRRRFLSLAAITAAGVGLMPACHRYTNTIEEMTGQERLDRTNLLLYRKKDGEICPVRSEADWKKRRQEILRGMQEVMGPFPDVVQVDAPVFTIHRERDEGTYVQRLIYYQSNENEQVPAWLLIPKQALESGAKLPAVLSPLGTGMSASAFGKEALDTGKFPRWNDHRDYARELAVKGYVILIPAYPHLGEYYPNLKALGYQSGTMKAIYDNIRGLDLLDELSFVDSGRYGAIGHSLGAHNSIYTAVFEHRIKVVVSSCGFDSYLDYMDGDISGWAQERYMPRILDYQLEDLPFDFHEIIGALAPRACFVNAPRGDSNFKWDSAAEVIETAMQIYNLYEVPERLKIDHPNAGHEFPDEQRACAYRFIERYL